MDSDAWITIGVIILVLAALVLNKVSTDIVICGGVTLLVLMGVLSPQQALEGMSNEGMITVALMYVVVSGLTRTGAVQWLGQRLLGTPKSLKGAQLRMILPVAGLSAFMNNTPLVAMFIPVISDWCKKFGFSPSKLMIPLSYAAIMGGTLTVIGTSTNLVVKGKWEEPPALTAPGVPAREPRPALGMFEIAWVGFPCAVAGAVYLMTVGRLLLPNRKPVLSVKDDARSYTVEMTVEPNGPLVDKTIEQAGLRHLPGLYLAEIERDGESIPAVGPEERLRANDRLVFVGILESVIDLRMIRGLAPATNQVGKLGTPRPQRSLIEAVVSNSSPLVGRSVREGRFRNRYNAVIIAVARNGERITDRKIGEIVLKSGDTLLLEAPRSFIEQNRDSRDFYLVSQIEGSEPIRHERAFLALAILGLMVAIATFGGPLGFGMIHAVAIAGGLMILTRCTSGSQARRSVDWQIVVIIAASLALGKALEVSGAAQEIAEGLISLAGGHPWMTLLMIYFTTMLMTEMITNNAAAMLVFPIAVLVAEKLNLDFKPFVMCIMMAASASFSTPIGYQTNLMVMSPGGYRFTDYFRVGVPLNLLMMIVTVLLAPLIWPFDPS